MGRPRLLLLLLLCSGVIPLTTFAYGGGGATPPTSYQPRAALLALPPGMPEDIVDHARRRCSVYRGRKQNSCITSYAHAYLRSREGLTTGHRWRQPR